MSIPRGIEGPERRGREKEGKDGHGEIRKPEAVIHHADAHDRDWNALVAPSDGQEATLRSERKRLRRRI